MTNGKLPLGWKHASLGDVAKYINGKAFKPEDWGTSGMPIIRIQNLNNTTAPFNYTTIDVEDKFIVKNGDLLYAWSASLGAYIWERKEACLNQHIFRIINNPSIIDKKYLFFALQQITEQLYSISHGVGMIHVTKGKFEKTTIPLPPLETQKKIVEKIDAAFTRLDEAIQLQQQNIQRAENLKKAVLEEVFGVERIESYPLRKLSDFDKIVAGGTPSRQESKYWIGGDINWFTSGELNTHHVAESKEKITSVAINESNAKIFPAGTLLIGMYDTAALKMSILTLPSACNQAIVGIKPDKKILNTEYLKFHLEFLRPKLLELRQGVRQQNLNAQKIKETKIYYPPLSVQHQIVAYLDEAFRAADKLLAEQRQRLAHLETMKKSILEVAFQGAL